MTTVEIRPVAIASVVFGVVVAVAGIVLGWSAWVWLPIALVPGVLVVLALAALHREHERDRRLREEMRRQSATTPPPPPQPEPAPEPTTYETSVEDIALASALDDYRFRFSATVRWTHDPRESAHRHPDPAAVARNLVLHRAAAVLRGESPEDVHVVAERLKAELGVLTGVPELRLRVDAPRVEVRVPDEDARTLAEHARLRRRAALWRDGIEHEQHVRAYLSEDVLRNPASAVVWWFARQLESENGLAGTIEAIEHLHRLTSAAHHTDIPPWRDDTRPTPDRDDGPVPASLFTLLPEFPTPADAPANGAGPEQGRAAEAPAEPDLVVAADHLGRELERQQRRTLYRQLADLLARHGFSDLVSALHARAEAELAGAAGPGHGPDTPGSEDAPDAADESDTAEATEPASAAHSTAPVAREDTAVSPEPSGSPHRAALGRPVVPDHPAAPRNEEPDAPDGSVTSPPF